ncbi:MAG: TonB-dependent receptor [Bacteroidota bacterium]
MKQLFLVLSMTVLFLGEAYTQTITGTVQSADDTPIINANVKVLNQPVGSVTDSDGKFQLSLKKGTYTLVISAIGYAIRSVEVTSGESSAPIIITLDEKTETLDQIVVTAQRQEELLVKTPISVTAINAQRIQETQTWELNDLAGIVPNYNYGELGVSFQQIQSIRGVQVFSENPALSTYIDGVNNLDILANGFALVDVERIEVLRGPQGTLFGRNAMGGVINIITKRPTNAKTGFFESSVGNLGLQRYALGAKSPIIDNKLFLGVTGLFERRQGFMENDTTGIAGADVDIQDARVGDQDRYYGNVALTWLPSQTFSATLNLKAQTEQSQASGFFVSPSSLARVEQDPDRIDLSRIGSHSRNVLNSSLTLTSIQESFSITSVSTYQQVELAFEDIVSGGIFHTFGNNRIGGTPDAQRVGTQEIKINSLGDGPLSYTAGLFGFVQNAFEPTTNLAIENAPDNYSITRNEGLNAGIAVFGQATYALTNNLSITGGLRYDYEERENTFNGFQPDFSPDLAYINGVFVEQQADTTISGSFSAFSPKVALTFSLNEQSSIFASYTRGFRAGGINAQRLPEGLDYTFDPEYSDNFEIGYKANTLEGTLYVAANAFYISWTDLQFFSEVAPFTFARGNVGDAVSYGVELESSYLPNRNIRLDAALGLNETEYQDFVLGISTPVDLSGNVLSNAPGHTGLLAANYTLPIRNAGNLTIRGEVRSIGRYYTDVQNTLRQDAYQIINTRLAYSTSVFELALWIQNLGDERFLVYGSPDTTFGNTRALASSPRTFGLTLTTQF